MIAEETKLACVHYLLPCVKRELRLPFILGEVLEIKNREEAEILELTPTGYLTDAVG